MIPSDQRFIYYGGAYFGCQEDLRTTTSANIWDWDQLRMVKVEGTIKIFPADEELEIPALAAVIDELPPNTTSVTFSDEGKVTKVSANPDEDETVFLAHLPFGMATTLHHIPTIAHSTLQELDRLAPMVDLKTYRDEEGVQRTVVFKFNPWGKDIPMLKAWNELNALARLPPHSNILALDRIVLDDIESRILGFTARYVEGGDLESLTEPFRLQWLEQLTQVVDFINLELGIMHQDIAPRNLLLDIEAQNIMLFDWDMVAFEREAMCETRNDVSGVIYTIYELITGDDTFAKTPHRDRDINSIFQKAIWPQNRPLDSDISLFRSHLNKWVASRRGGNDVERILNAPRRIQWPQLPTAPDYEVPCLRYTTTEGKKVVRPGPRLVGQALEAGQFVFRWERPPQKKTPAGTSRFYAA